MSARQLARFTVVWLTLFTGSVSRSQPAELFAPAPTRADLSFPRWLTDEAVARTLAGAENKPLLLYTYVVDEKSGRRAAYCRDFETNVLNHPAVVKALDGVILYRCGIDRDDQRPSSQAFLTAFGLADAPLLTILDVDGAKLGIRGQVVGRRTLEECLPLLRDILLGVARADQSPGSGTGAPPGPGYLKATDVTDLTWYEDTSTAFAAARTLRKPIVAFYYFLDPKTGRPSRFCHDTMRVTLAHPDVRRALKGSVVVALDVGKDDQHGLVSKMVKRLRIDEFPMVAVLENPPGQEIHVRGRIIGYHAPDQLLEGLRWTMPPGYQFGTELAPPIPNKVYSYLRPEHDLKGFARRDFRQIGGRVVAPPGIEDETRCLRLGRPGSPVTTTWYTDFRTAYVTAWNQNKLLLVYYYESEGRGGRRRPRCERFEQSVLLTPEVIGGLEDVVLCALDVNNDDEFGNITSLVRGFKIDGFPRVTAYFANPVSMFELASIGEADPVEGVLTSLKQAQIDRSRMAAQEDRWSKSLVIDDQKPSGAADGLGQPTPTEVGAVNQDVEDYLRGKAVPSLVK